MSCRFRPVDTRRRIRRGRNDMHSCVAWRSWFDEHQPRGKEVNILGFERNNTDLTTGRDSFWSH